MVIEFNISGGVKDGGKLTHFEKLINEIENIDKLLEKQKKYSSELPIIKEGLSKLIKKGDILERYDNLLKLEKKKNNLENELKQLVEKRRVMRAKNSLITKQEKEIESLKIRIEESKDERLLYLGENNRLTSDISDLSREREPFIKRIKELEKNKAESEKEIKKLEKENSKLTKGLKSLVPTRVKLNNIQISKISSNLIKVNQELTELSQKHSREKLEEIINLKKEGKKKIKALEESIPLMQKQIPLLENRKRQISYEVEQLKSFIEKNKHNQKRIGEIDLEIEQIRVKKRLFIKDIKAWQIESVNSKFIAYGRKDSEALESWHIYDIIIPKLNQEIKKVEKKIKIATSKKTPKYEEIHRLMKELKDQIEKIDFRPIYDKIKETYLIAKDLKDDDDIKLTLEFYRLIENFGFKRNDK